MINLPEVEVIKRDLEREAVGNLAVKSVDILSEGVTTPDDETFGERLERGKIVGVNREGLNILVKFSNDERLSVFLGSGGSLLRKANREELHPKTRVVFQLVKYGQLRLLDFKKGARLKLFDPGKTRSRSRRGIDPLSAQIAWTDFANYVGAAEPLFLKDFLGRNSLIVGLGQMYSDEVLFKAGLRYDRMTNSLGRQECRRLWRAIVEVVNDAVKYRGTTLPDGLFRSLDGSPGQFVEHLNVYHRDGQLSPRSRRPLVRVKHRGRWTYFCEQSQV